MEKVITFLALVVLGVVGISIISVLFAFPLMWCWNYVVPSLFGLKTINWSEAWCLMLISNCLIKSTNTSTK